MSTNSILASAPLTSTNYILKANGTTIGNSLIWDNGTNVGIGNTNTSYTLDVSGTGRFTGALTGAAASFSGMITSTVGNNAKIFDSASATTGYQYFQMSNSVGTMVLGVDNNAGTGLAINSLANAVVLNNSANAPLILGTNNTARMTITSAGNVLVNKTTSSGYNFEVSGAAYYDKSDGTYIALGYGGSVKGYIGISSQTQVSGVTNGIGLASANDMTFATGGSALERMRITSGGNVGIGTASPSEKLHLYDATYPVIRMSAGAATTDSYYLYANQSARFYITNVSSGNGAYLVYNSSSGWTGVSDARWKTDWTDLDGSLNLINRLNIGKYKMLNNDKEVIKNARWDYGIKAQELLDIIPDAVDVPKDENDKYGVIHNIVFYNAIKAIQELSAQVQEQNQTIQSLQEQINILAK